MPRLAVCVLRAIDCTTKTLATKKPAMASNPEQWQAMSAMSIRTWLGNVVAQPSVGRAHHQKAIGAPIKVDVELSGAFSGPPRRQDVASGAGECVGSAGYSTSLMYVLKLRTMET
jgi:hypothetical protein